MMTGLVLFLSGVVVFQCVVIWIHSFRIEHANQARDLWIREAECQSAAARQAERALSSLFDRYEEVARERMRDESRISTLPKIVPAMRQNRG